MDDKDSEKESLEKRYRILSEKISQSPNSAYLRERLGTTCLELGKRDEALENFKKSLELDPSLEDVVHKLKTNFNPEELKDFKFPERPKPFYQDLNSVIKYPWVGGGKLIILVGALVFTILSFIPIVGGLLLLIFAWPYIISYMLKILRHTADGKKELPDWPEISDYWESILLPFLQVLLASAISYAPAILILLLGIRAMSFLVVLLYIIFLILGTIYFPMALIAVALHDSALIPLDFKLLLESIGEIKKDYFLALVALGVIILISGIVNLLVSSIPFIGTYIFWAATLYFVAMQMHILGNIYYINKTKLRWF